MPAAENQDIQDCKNTVFKIAMHEREREAALRVRHASFWASASGTPREAYDAFIAACPLTDDVTLGAVDQQGVQGWWVRPEHGRADQAILYIHGGGYVLGSSQAYRGFVSQLVSRTQIPALVIDYPLAPEASIPAAPQAALTAWRWLQAQGCKEIAVVGDSAGGGLSLVTLAQLAKAREQSRSVAGVVFSPWTDLAFTGASMADAAVTDPLIGHDYLKDCAQKYLGTADAVDPLASPLHGDLRGLPPLLIQVGTDERLLDDSRQYASRAARAGVSVELEVWEGMHHVFQLDVEGIDSSRKALDRAARFLRDAFSAQ
jgi:acetyl esterase/lipase